MKLILKIIIFFILIINKSIFAQSIAIVNIQNLIDTNEIYIDVVEEMEINQKLQLKDLEGKENELIEIFNQIENSKLILSENELNLQVSNYNNKLNNFTLLVDEFNYHYQNQIIVLRERVLNEIILILQKYATENKLDLILDSTSYLIASNSLDITEIIFNELAQVEFTLQYENFEKN